MKCGINIILRLLLWYFYYGNCKSNRGTVIVVKRFFSLAKTIVVDVFVIYIPRIPLWYFLLWEVWKRPGGGLVEVWWRSGGGLVEVCWRYGGGLVEVLLEV